VKRSGTYGIAIVAFLGCSSSASAHIVSTRLGDFFTGGLHPLTDPVDWAVWVAVASMAALSGRDSARWLVLTAPLSLVAGFALSLFIGTRAGLTVDGFSLCSLGLLLASGWRLATGRLLFATSAVLLLRGCANAAGFAVGADTFLYASGLGLAGYAAVTLLSALALRLLSNESAWRRILVRVIGSWMAAVGLMVLAYGLRH